jgi:hypothetical protein
MKTMKQINLSINLKSILIIMLPLILCTANSHLRKSNLQKNINSLSQNSLIQASENEQSASKKSFPFAGNMSCPPGYPILDRLSWLCYADCEPKDSLFPYPQLNKNSKYFLPPFGCPVIAAIITPI